MSNLGKAIKKLTTEGTKKRYWPSKNPIDDPSDFPGEQNFGEEEEEPEYREHEYNMFHVKQLNDSINARIEKLSGGAFVGGASIAAAQEVKMLRWLKSELDSLGKQAIDRRDFQKIMKSMPRTGRLPYAGVTITQMLDAALPGAQELTAAKAGPYGSMEGEEEDEFGRDQGAMYDDDHDEHEEEYQTQQCASCGGDGCDLCDYSGDFGQWVPRGEENEETEDRDDEEFQRGWDDHKERDISDKYRKSADNPYGTSGNGFDDYHEEDEEERDYCQTCGGKGYTDSGTVGAEWCDSCGGNGKRQSAEQERAERSYFNRKMGFEEDEEQKDCPECGNTGYSMANGQPCPSCDQGKAEKMAMQHADIPEEQEEVKMPTTKYAKTLRQWMKK